MPKPKINDRKLLHLVDKKGFNQSQAARKLGVCRQAVSKRLQELRGRTTRVVVAKKIEQIVDHKIDRFHQRFDIISVSLTQYILAEAHRVVLILFKTR